MWDPDSELTDDQLADFLAAERARWAAYRTKYEVSERGRREFTPAELEQGFGQQPFPCHPEARAGLAIELAHTVNVWEQQCPWCGRAWRFIREGPGLFRAPIDAIDDPNHEQTRPIDAWAALARRAMSASD